MGKKTYRAVRAFPHGHASIEVGVTLPLTDKQAIFLKTGGFIEEVAQPVKAAPAIQPAGESDAATKKESK